MKRIITPYPVEREHEEMLIEMANVMFELPNAKIHNENNVISINTWTALRPKGIWISWMEFCLLHVAPVLKIEPLWTNNIFKDLFEESTHPIEYLYIEFCKQYKNGIIKVDPDEKIIIKDCASAAYYCH